MPGRAVPATQKDNPGNDDIPDIPELEEGQKTSSSIPVLTFRCPSCGQAMRLQQTIQPAGRCPP